MKPVVEWSTSPDKFEIRNSKSEIRNSAYHLVSLDLSRKQRKASHGNKEQHGPRGQKRRLRQGHAGNNPADVHVGYKPPCLLKLSKESGRKDRKSTRLNSSHG